MVGGEAAMQIKGKSQMIKLFLELGQTSIKSDCMTNHRANRRTFYRGEFASRM